jgi:hypothetical protein
LVRRLTDKLAATTPSPFLICRWAIEGRPRDIVEPQVDSELGFVTRPLYEIAWVTGTGMIGEYKAQVKHFLKMH